APIQGEPSERAAALPRDARERPGITTSHDRVRDERSIIVAAPPPRNSRFRFETIRRDDVPESESHAERPRPARRAARFAISKYDAATASEVLIAAAAHAGAGDALYRQIERDVPRDVAVVLRPVQPPRRSVEAPRSVAEPLHRLA